MNEQAPARTRQPLYYTDFFGVRLDVPLTAGEALLALPSWGIVSAGLVRAAVWISEPLLTEPSPVRIIPVLAALLVSSALLRVAGHLYRPADAAQRIAASAATTHQL